MSEQKWRYGRPRPFWPWPVGFALVLFALGGAALAVAALAAEGESRLFGLEHIRRGYGDLAGTLRSLGADAVCRRR